MGDMVQNDISALLPFYLNGTLGAADAVRVKLALQDDAGLQAELEMLRHMRAAVRGDIAGNSPGEIGLARLRREIADAPPVVQSRRYAPLAAAFVMGAVVSALIAAAALRAPEETYRQAGAGVAPMSLVVAFRADARSEQISDLLLAQDAVIIDGPSAIGLYRLSVPEGADLDATVAGLVAATDIVESAEKAE